uniref:Uncharacterized protein n=1 Tax=Anguilla anguilla TaxID=7936 RepID=A0A0E9T2N2_ANGAN
MLSNGTVQKVETYSLSVTGRELENAVPDSRIRVDNRHPRGQNEIYKNSFLV